MGGAADSKPETGGAADSKPMGATAPSSQDSAPARAGGAPKAAAVGTSWAMTTSASASGSLVSSGSR
eukprot:scaffold252990_cov39-Prasinocladus_malaysianus.AAC.1